MQSVRAETVADIGLDFLERNGDEEFFLHLQFWDPHSPYFQPEEKVDQMRLPEKELPPYPTEEQIQTHLEWDTWGSASELGVEDRKDLADLLARYDSEIRNVDWQIGRIFDRLKELNIYEETLLVVTADHGEEFGEHGAYQQHWATYDGTQRVPLIVKLLGGAENPGPRNQLVTNVDLAPTLVEYAGLETPSKWQGQSFRSVIENPDAAWRDFIVLDHGLHTAQRAVRTDRWKFVRTYHPSIWKGELPERQLFDLQEDPWEQVNCIDEHPDVASELADRMILWVDEHVGRFGDPMHDVVREEPGPQAFNPNNQYKGI
jgi:arylsulfatase A-like enzyme